MTSVRGGHCNWVYNGLNTNGKLRHTLQLTGWRYCTFNLSCQRPLTNEEEAATAAFRLSPSSCLRHPFRSCDLMARLGPRVFRCWRVSLHCQASVEPHTRQQRYFTAKATRRSRRKCPTGPEADGGMLTTAKLKIGTVVFFEF